jgi:RNA polymerase sigma factor (sigma-70 family)
VTDAEIIARSREDESAFASLFDRHYAALYRFLRARVGVVLADDLASEVFLTAFRRRASYDLGREDARPWLFGIAVNVVRDHRRSELRRLAANARAVDGDRADEIMAADRLDPALANALLCLSERERHVVLLFAWAQLTYEEIAEALEVPIGTVRSRLSRARATLRESLAPVEECS